MLLRSVEDCKLRAHDLGVRLAAVDSPPTTGSELPYVHFSLDAVPYAEIALARKFVSWLGEYRDCEFWISEFGIWPSREDWNLYTRLRNSYGDSRELFEAPAHLFGAQESEDLATFLSIAIQFGWGGHIVPDPPGTCFFLSHDGWVHVSSMEALALIESDLDELEIAYETHESE